MEDLQFHEAAAVFPLLEGKPLEKLAADIVANGLRQPIALFEGKILDGRNRYKACQMADVEPDLVNVDPPDPVAYVVSVNLHRRHLTKAQRAMVAARAMGLFAERAKRRQMVAGKIHGRGQKEVENLPPPMKARDEAGASVGVSGRSVDLACQVLNKGSPALCRAVDRGALTVSLAARATKLPAETQDKIANSAQPRATAESALAATKPAAKDGLAVLSRCLRQISQRLQDLAKNHGSPNQLIKDAKRPGDVSAVRELIQEIYSILGRFDTEAQACAEESSANAGCRPESKPEAVLRMEAPTKLTPERRAIPLDDVAPCEKCGSLELWQDSTGNWRCRNCAPPTLSPRLAEKARQLGLGAATRQSLPETES